MSSRSVLVHLPDRGEVRCTLRGNLFRRRSARKAWVETDESRPVAVGDRVEVALDGDEGTLESVEERRNCLSRLPPKARGGKRLVIAANIDTLIVVASIDDPPFRPGLVDRLLVAAAMEGIEPALCLNKVDLGGDRSVTAPYVDAGVSILETSADTGEGIEALRERMSRGVSLLVGHSGVGKSSLLNAVSPGLDLKVGEVTAYHGRGRHTTTRVTLLPLASGGWVVDSPGIREFGLDRVPPAALARLYPGLGSRPDDCKFNDCLHRREPGCAVRAAVEDGSLAVARFEGYLRALEQIEVLGR